MSDSEQIRTSITAVCTFVALFERGDQEAAQEVLDSLDRLELESAFSALAGGYVGLASMMGMSMANLDDPEVVESFVEQAEWAMKMLKGRMGYN